VLELVEPGALQQRARAVASAMGTLSGVAFGMTKAALLRSSASDIGPMIDTEIQAQGLAFLSGYAAEAGRRFVAREPLPFQWPAPGAPAEPSPNRK
jgi:threonine/homoserine/homoserine lactone efflux protein